MTTAGKLHLQIKELQEQYDAERAWLLLHMTSQNLDDIDQGGFKFKVTKRANWTYSTEIANELFRIDNLKKAEQNSGQATNNPSIYVGISVPKVKE